MIGAFAALNFYSGSGTILTRRFARARAVEFGEEDHLPAAQREAAVLDPDGFGEPDERRLDVRIGIAFGVAIVAVVRDQPVEGRFHIARDVGIVAFVDHHAGRRVRNVEMAHAVHAAGIAHELFDFVGDVLEFGAARRPYLDCVCAGNGFRGHGFAITRLTLWRKII